MTNCCMTHCPVTGAYIKRFIPAVLLAFAFIYVYDIALNVGLLMDTYNQTPELWRSVSDMQSKLPFTYLTQFFMAFVIGVIFTKNYEGKGLCEGVRFGILIGLLLGILAATPYAWLPVTKELAMAWFAGGLVKGLGLGFIYAAIYKDPCCSKEEACATEKTACCATEGKEKDKKEKKGKGCCG